MFRNAMVIQGVDSMGDQWWISWLHSGEVVESTREAFDRSIKMLKENLADRFEI
jgi:hypothetical protein